MVLFGIGKSLDSNCVHPKQLYANLNNFSDLKIVNESKPKVLYDVIPIIRLVPTPMNEINRDNTYACPVYKTSERKGTLSTTGHSTNFVLWIDFPRKDFVGAPIESKPAVRANAISPKSTSTFRHQASAITVAWCEKFRKQALIQERFADWMVMV